MNGHDAEHKEVKQTLEDAWKTTMGPNGNTPPSQRRKGTAVLEAECAAVDAIDLSPIEESALSKLSKVNKVDFQYGTHGPEYVKRFNGKRIRVGFKKRTMDWTAKHGHHPHSAHLRRSGKVEYNPVSADNSQRERLETLSQVDEDSRDSATPSDDSQESSPETQ